MCVIAVFLDDASVESKRHANHPPASRILTPQAALTALERGDLRMPTPRAPLKIEKAVQIVLRNESKQEGGHETGTAYRSWCKKNQTGAVPDLLLRLEVVR